MTIVEKAAYLKGLCEGLGVDPDSRDGKLWGALNELLSDMAHEIEDLQSGSLDFADTLDEFGDELSYLEELTCDLDRPEDMDDEFCSGDCESCEYDCFSDEEDEGEEDEDEDEDEDDGEPGYDGVLYDVKCPVCGEEITFDEDTLEEGSIECPKCGETLEFDLSGEEK
jgi:ribosomal protein S27E